MEASPAELQKAEELKNTRLASASLPEPAPITTDASTETPSTPGNALQGATSGFLRNAWSSLPFGLLNPFLGVLSLGYINLHFVLAYLGGPLSQFFNKFGTEWIDALALVPAKGTVGAAAGGFDAVKNTAPGKMLVATLELGEIFIMLVLDALLALVVLAVVALFSAVLQISSSATGVLPGLAT